MSLSESLSEALFELSLSVCLPFAFGCYVLVVLLLWLLQCVCVLRPECVLVL